MGEREYLLPPVKQEFGSDRPAAGRNELLYQGKMEALGQGTVVVKGFAAIPDDPDPDGARSPSRLDDERVVSGAVEIIEGAFDRIRHERVGRPDTFLFCEPDRFSLVGEKDEILEKLHKEHESAPKESTLSGWVALIDTVVKNLKSSLPFNP